MKFFEFSIAVFLIIVICSGCALGLGNYMYDEWWHQPDEKEQIEKEQPIPLTPKKGEKKLCKN